MIAKIAVAAANFAIDKPYSYFVPLDMKLAPGMRVQVPFGRGNRQTEGVVLQIVDGDRGELKAVERCLDEEALLSDTMLHLAAFLRDSVSLSPASTSFCLASTSSSSRAERRSSEN